MYLSRKSPEVSEVFGNKRNSGDDQKNNNYALYDLVIHDLTTPDAGKKSQQHKWQQHSRRLKALQGYYPKNTVQDQSEGVVHYEDCADIGLKLIAAVSYPSHISCKEGSNTKKAAQNSREYTYYPKQKP